MHFKASALLLSTILALTFVATALVVVDNWFVSGRRAESDEFQRLMGGLGTGPALTMSPCEFSFDTRIASTRPASYHPLICGEYFCPQQTISIFYLRPLPRETEWAPGER